jgi:hypothetical protein
MRTAFIAAVLACAARAATAESDPVLAAAVRALDAGQPVSALGLLRDHPGLARPGAARLAQARAMAALGRHAEAARQLQVADPAALGAWPELLRGEVAALLGEASAAAGDALAARAWLELACRHVGEGLAVDRVLVLLAELCDRTGDQAAAQRYAHVVWRDWPRSPLRARAGLIEARLLAARAPDQARALLAGVRAMDGVEESTRVAAAELLCRLLLPTRPGPCLVVAEQELRTAREPGQLPLYRALALAAFDPVEGAAALQRLPPVLAGDPAARAALQRLALGSGTSDDRPQRIERARAELELGRLAEARAMLEPLAASEPLALALLAEIPGVPLDGFLASAAIADATAATAVGIAFARRGEHSRAWPLLQRVLGGAAATPSASLLFWGARAARQQAPAEAQRLASRLLALDEPGIETGLAWAEEAQRLEHEDAGADRARAAWERAARALPNDHAWHAAATWRAAKPLVESASGLDRARALLERVEVSAQSQDHLRCRFLLAQVHERGGRGAEALEIIQSLRQRADAAQAEKLQRMEERLRAAVASEPPPGPP